jgi:hypothetical protein
VVEITLKKNYGLQGMATLTVGTLAALLIKFEGRRKETFFLSK